MDASTSTIESMERKDGGADYDHENLQVVVQPCHGKKGAGERVKRGAREY
jgi:hypothetical protein